METFERARLDAYFARIASQFAPDELTSSFLITHLLSERPAFVRAVAAMSRLTAVLPKPKSVHPAAQRETERTVAVDTLTRELFTDPDTALDYFESRAAGEPISLLDVGGYFAPTLTDLHSHFTGRLVGVVEDTENGHRRYEALDKLRCPVISVARSPLKDPEDYLVGQSVVFSTEAVMRGRGDILHGRPALVIGFGKLGSSIARLLHAKGVQVTVFDIDPVRRTQALSQGFTVARDRESALTGAGLVLCATGAVSLRGEDFSHLRNGAYVATVTSSEDEARPRRPTGRLHPHGRRRPHHPLPNHRPLLLSGQRRQCGQLHPRRERWAVHLPDPGRNPRRDQDAHPQRSRTWHPRGPRIRPRGHRGDLALLLQQVITMPITANHIRTTLTAYLDQHPEDKHEIDIVQGLLDSGDDLTSRESLPGHVTAGAILVGRDGRVLHILHNATGTWLLPGGHIESSDHTLLQTMRP